MEAVAPSARRAGEDRELVAQQQVLEHQVSAPAAGGAQRQEQQRQQSQDPTRVTGAPAAGYA